MNTAPWPSGCRELRRYVQNHVAADPNRRHPGWDAVIELYWDDWESMEAAWRAPEGQASTDHLAEFVDLARSTWSVVNEEVRRGGPSESAGPPSKFSVDERQH